MLEYFMVFWIVAGVLSCLIFTHSERHLIRGMELIDAVMLMIFCICFVLMGPIGLTVILIAKLLVFLTNR